MCVKLCVITSRFYAQMKYSIRFFLEKRKDKEGTLITKNVPLLMEVTFRGLRFRKNVGVRLNVEQWLEESQTMKRNNFTAQGESSTEVNAKINDFKSRVGRIMARCEVDGILPTVSFLTSELGREAKVRLVADVMDEFMEVERINKGWSTNTYRNFVWLMRQLREFNPKLEFADLSEDTLTRFVMFLLNEKQFRNCSIVKSVRLLKWFLNYATRKGYNKVLDYREFNVTLKGANEKTVLFLRWDELMHLYHLEIGNRRLEQIRDVFCFCCFTGLRHSDVYNLKWSNIKKDHIDIVTVKTDDPIIIDLNDYSRAILEKYRGYGLQDDKCLPVVKTQRMNEQLKELGQLAGFNDPITTVYFKGSERIEETKPKWAYLTTHLGRKTFTASAIYLGIPAEVLMKWTGHKSHAMLEKYYDIVDEHRKAEMNKFNKGVGNE